MRLPKFHPLSDMPLFESQRTLRGHAFYPPAQTLRTLARTPALPSESAPCVVYHSPWGHLVVTGISPADLTGYGWVRWSSDPDGAEWGDLGYLGEYEKRRGQPYEYWERDLHSRDANAAAALSRILTRCSPPARHTGPSESEAAVPDRSVPTGPARVPRRSRGVMSHR